MGTGEWVLKLGVRSRKSLSGVNRLRSFWGGQLKPEMAKYLPVLNIERSDYSLSIVRRESVAYCAKDYLLCFLG